MFSAKWLNFILLLGLINYSYEYNRRRTRDAQEDAAKDSVSKMLEDEGALEEEAKKEIDRMERAMTELSREIKRDATELINMVVRDARTFDKWQDVQDKLRSAFRLITDAYRKFIETQRNTCKLLEDFAYGIIRSYDDEWNRINSLKPPRRPDGEIDTDNPDYDKFQNQWYSILKYLHFYAQSLPTAIDPALDLTRSMYTTRFQVTNPPVTRTMYVQTLPPVFQQQQIQPTVVQRVIVPQQQPLDLYQSQNLFTPINCGATADYNGNLACPNSLCGRSRVLLDDACQNICPMN